METQAIILSTGFPRNEKKKKNIWGFKVEFIEAYIYLYFRLKIKTLQQRLARTNNDQ